MRRKKNMESIVQFLLLLVMALLLTSGMVGGKVKYYVHPRYYAGIWISIFILFIFAGSALADIRKARHNPNLKQYLIYGLPIVVVLLFPTQGIGNAQMNLTLGVQTAQKAGEDNETPEEGKATENKETAADEETTINGEYDSYLQEDNNGGIKEDGEDNTGNSLKSSDNLSDDNLNESSSGFEEYGSYDDMSEKYSGEIIDGATVIKDDYFASWYYDSFDYLEDFIGKRYQFTAQVFFMEELKKNQFLAGRYVMVCCAADVSGFGLICETDSIGELKEEEWISVTGTIKEGTYNGTKVPVLTDVVITKRKAPADEYVYYNFY